MKRYLSVFLAASCAAALALTFGGSALHLTERAVLAAETASGAGPGGEASPEQARIQAASGQTVGAGNGAETGTASPEAAAASGTASSSAMPPEDSSSTQSGTSTGGSASAPSGTGTSGSTSAPSDTGTDSSRPGRDASESASAQTGEPEASGSSSFSAADSGQNSSAALVGAAAGSDMYRLYNPNSGEHFYTGSTGERDQLRSAGWTYEGIGWTAPVSSGSPVYRLYNPNAGDHHYTMSGAERDHLVAVGWRFEGVAWNSASSSGRPLYRLYNPNCTGAGAHHYTASSGERDHLVAVGWRYEGIGWYGIAGSGQSGSTAASAKNRFCISGLNNGDAKFLGDRIITSVGGKFAVFTLDGARCSGNYGNYNISMNWFSVDESTRTILYSNALKQVGMILLDRNYNIAFHKVLWKASDLCIDPTLLNVNGTFYFTVTKIRGKVNNADPNAANGTYTFVLYRTDTAGNYTEIGTVLSKSRNLEDADLVLTGGRLTLVYEEELYDGGVSAIRLLRANDSTGKSWTSPVTLVDMTADDEPATFTSSGNGYVLYYSSDAGNVGASYLCGRVHKAVYSSLFARQSDTIINMGSSEGVLLYDVRESSGRTQFLYAGNYHKGKADLLLDEL